MSKPQVKTQNILNLIKELNNKLISNNDITLSHYTCKDSVTLSYEVCVRRDSIANVAKRFKPTLDKFALLWNQTPFSKDNKLAPINLAHYTDDEYDEYEITVGLDVSIKLGKDQSKFFDN